MHTIETFMNNEHVWSPQTGSKQTSQTVGCLAVGEQWTTAFQKGIRMGRFKFFVHNLKKGSIINAKLKEIQSLLDIRILQT